MLGSEGSIWGVMGTSAAICAALYLLWRHHPSYGANPGLPCFPVLGAVPLILLNKHRFYEWTCEHFERAQALTICFFIGPLTAVATADPQNVQHILKSHFEYYPKGPIFHSNFSDLLGSGIFNCDGPIWRFQRKVASYVFTSSSLKDFVIEIGSTEIVARLLPAVDFACASLAGRSIDLQALMMDFTFDTISQLTFGADPACLTGCKVVISNVDANVQHEEVHINTDISHVKADTQHGDLRANIHDKTHMKVQVQHESLLANTHGQHGSSISTGAESLSLHGEHDDRGIRDSSIITDVQKCQKRMEDVTTGPSYMKVPDDLIQGFVRGFEVAILTTASRFLTPEFIWKTQRALKMGSEKKLFYALEAINKFARFAIEKSKHDLVDERKDLLSRFMRMSKPQVESLLEGEDEAAWKANNDEHGQILSDSFLKDILISFLLAGREAIASGITFMMWLLCVHPKVEKAVYEEIKRIMNDRELNQSDAVDGNASVKMGTFSFEELKRMNYMHAALFESMRLYPPIPSNPKFAAQDDVLPNGTRIHKGAQVSYNVFAMGRAEKVWGKDCLEFRPERWIGEDGQFVHMSPYKYPVFQAGPRICLGKDLALIEMKLVVASLVQNFEFKLSPGFKPKMWFGANLSMRNGLPLTIKRRQQDFDS